MNIRCPNCHSTVWFQVTAGAPAVTTRCISCSQEFDVLSRLSSDQLASIYQDARKFGKAAGIDLAGAYSVLLGIMSVNELRDACARTLKGDGSTDTESEITYDPSFCKAVESGWLTLEQAVQRGNRNALVQQLIARHGLSERQAGAVADNRVSLLKALRGRTPRERIELRLDETRRFTPRVLLVAALLIVVAVLVGLSYNQRDEVDEAPLPRTASESPAITPPIVRGSIEIRKDPTGHLTQVSGPDPLSVLDAYCKSTASVGVDPIGLETSPEGWTGLYQKDGSVYALAIRQDPSSNLWVVGDSSNPIAARPARR